MKRMVLAELVMLTANNVNWIYGVWEIFFLIGLKLSIIRNLHS